MYIYVLNKDFSYKVKDFTHWGSHRFYDEKAKLWLEINDNTIFVKAGYATDGCTPKINIFGWVVGTPDGPIMYDGYPQTYWASLVHDALVQFSKEPNMPYSKKQIDQIFYTMLKECNWKWAGLYYSAVRLFSKITFQD